jgi:CDGSH-type Zn-finger protein
MNDVVIVVRENGPYKVSGPIAVVDTEGREFVLPPGTAVALCRCGHSQTKPFCDATHRRVGFVADDVSPRREPGSAGPPGPVGAPPQTGPEPRP